MPPCGSGLQQFNPDPVVPQNFGWPLSNWPHISHAKYGNAAHV